MSGNEAIGEAAIIAGCYFYAGYPITPQNELTAYMARRMREKGRIFIQAESELAAINMVFGASSTGKRAMTSSSSPGISLKQEGISYLAAGQLPCLIVNIMRGGPGLGNIASSQSDYFQATRGGGHGDYYTPVLAPWSVQEAFDLVLLGFDLADYYRTPVIILGDAIIAHMREPVVFHQKSMFRKKLPSKNWALTGAHKREQNIIRTLLLKDGALEEHNKNLYKKYEKIKKHEQLWHEYKIEDAKFVIVSYGSQARICLEAVELLRKKGIKIGLYRPITLWPYPYVRLRELGDRFKKVFVVEQSMGQMVEDVKLSLLRDDIYFLGRAGGGVPSVEEIIKFVKNRIR